jgi:hypothetical protein
MKQLLHRLFNWNHPGRLKKLPPGYTVETDNIWFRCRTPDGTQLNSQPYLSFAVEDGIYHYETEGKRKGWATIPNPTEGN